MSFNGCHLVFASRYPLCHCEERSDVAIPPAVKGGEKTYHWGGVKLYHLGGA